MTLRATIDFSDQIRRVAREWSHPDDWGVDSISLTMLGTLIDWLEVGVPWSDILAHAGHTDNCTDRCLPMKDEGVTTDAVPVLP